MFHVAMLFAFVVLINLWEQWKKKKAYANWINNDIIGD